MEQNEIKTKPTGEIVMAYLHERDRNAINDLYDATEIDDEYLDGFFKGELAVCPALLDELEILMPDIPRSYWRSYDTMYRFERLYSAGR